ncbi:hypothetical protein B9Z55_027968 [Caenorhabditis nigoni]|uniref:Uncharacterized protein n=1 Tax=Caenorhabditis nigoni TaxID=1611254 RepID=A0A2G5SDU4_9PELO|nr:hypothetical protein B9Z55_027968 [Caenorhabditis nigoni]
MEVRISFLIFLKIIISILCLLNFMAQIFDYLTNVYPTFYYADTQIRFRLKKELEKGRYVEKLQPCIVF